MKFSKDSIKNVFKSKKKEVKIEDVDENERDTWGGQLDFFLSSLGYAGEFKIFDN